MAVFGLVESCLIVNEVPETRDSLLVRVADPQDRDAWEQFARIYRPVADDSIVSEARLLELPAQYKRDEQVVKDLYF
jgi:hypothetical protein